MGDEDSGERYHHQGELQWPRVAEDNISDEPRKANGATNGDVQTLELQNSQTFSENAFPVCSSVQGTVHYLIQKKSSNGLAILPRSASIDSSCRVHVPASSGSTLSSILKRKFGRPQHQSDRQLQKGNNSRSQSSSLSYQSEDKEVECCGKRGDT